MASDTQCMVTFGGPFTAGPVSELLRSQTSLQAKAALSSKNHIHKVNLLAIPRFKTSIETPSNPLLNVMPSDAELRTLDEL